MKKKTISIAAAAGALALAAPVAASAHGRHHHHHHRFGPAVAGTVSSVDAGAQTAVVHVTAAGRRLRALNGTDVTVALTGARVKVADTNGDGTTSLADVATGDRVVVKLRRSARTAAAGTPLAARALFDRTHAPARAAFKR